MMPVTVTRKKTVQMTTMMSQKRSQIQNLKVERTRSLTNPRKKVDALKAKFTERFRTLKETNPEILPVYTNPKQKPA